MHAAAMLTVQAERVARQKLAEHASQLSSQLSKEQASMQKFRAFKSTKFADTEGLHDQIAELQSKLSVSKLAAQLII